MDGLGTLGDSIEQLQTTTTEVGKNTLETLEEVLNAGVGVFNVGNLISSIMLILIGYAFIKLIYKTLDRMLKRLPIDPTLYKFIESAIQILMYFLLALIVLKNLGIDITSMIALLSVAGLAVSLAIENSLSNLAGGVTILVTKPFAKNDFVEAGGVMGTVQEIGLVYTELLTPDNKIIHVPNKEISAEKVINYTASGERRVDLVINASYDSPIETVKSALMDAMNSSSYLVENPDFPMTGVLEYGANSISYAARIWVKADDYWLAYFELMEAVKRSFDKYGCQMTYDHVNVHIVEK
ncbi:MAG: mechanosensitive ion channel family protein [Lachnospiraceae bacterium]